MPNEKAPIALLSRDRKAKAFLKKHANDPVIGGGFSACLPYHSYTKILSTSRLAAVNALNEVMDMLSEKDRELAQMFLSMTPRAIAKKLGMRRSLLYDRLRKLRARAFRLAAKKRAGYVNQRDGRADLDTNPALIAQRTLQFTLHEKTRFAYLVEREDEQVWVDAGGNKFSPEVCDLLDNCLEDVNDAESPLEIEEW